MMPLHRFTLRILSPTGSLWHADTLFGSLCWQVAHREGAEGVTEFIRQFADGDPPFVLSDGFPRGLLPRPLLFDWEPPESTETNSARGVKQRKRFRKAGWLTTAQFIQAQKGQVPDSEPVDGSWLTVSTLHASIDRNTGRTGGEGSAGELFATEGRLPRPVSADQPEYLLDFYARGGETGLKRLQYLLDSLSQVGFGKKKTVGFGQFAVVDCCPVPELDDWNGANGWVSLSSYVPSPGDPLKGRWKLRTKYGKLGEEKVRSGQPFKRPLIQFEPGASFRLSAPSPGWYGSIVRDVAPGHPEVVQNCQTVALPFRFPPS